MENAIVAPFTEPCKHIWFEAKPADKGLQMIIRDNGIGIKQSDLCHIFDVGFSTNNTSGLGLPFAKRILEDNEGSIDVCSTPGKGTIVTIFLPSFDE